MIPAAQVYAASGTPVSILACGFHITRYARGAVFIPSGPFFGDKARAGPDGFHDNGNLVPVVFSLATALPACSAITGKKFPRTLFFW